MFKVYDIYPPTTNEKPAVCGKNAHGSTLTELPDGTIMVAWYCGSYEKCADVGIFTASFNPKTEQWTPVTLLEKHGPTKSEGNPVLFYDSETKRLWLFWSTMDRADYKHLTGGWSLCKIKCKASDDLGKTWSPVRYLTHLWGRMTRNKVIRMSNGEVLLPLYSEFLGYKGNIWVTSREEFAKGPLHSIWKKVGTIPGGVEQPNVIELENGHLLCYLRSSHGGPHNPYVSISESFDFGRKWTRIRKGILPNCNAGLSLTKLQNGHLLTAFNNSSEIRNPLSVAISDDNGTTWPFIRDLEKDEDKRVRFAYPESIQAKDGSLYCTYTNRNGINIRCAHFDEAWIRSK